MSRLAEIADALEKQGLTLRGAFWPEKKDAVPPLGHGRAAATLLLAGNTGPALWRAYAPHRHTVTMDDWCKAALGEIAARFDATLLLPQDGPPFLPFPSWAKRAETVASSPLGILIHPDYGLWHGYRGALIFAERLELSVPVRRENPCRSCPDKACLSTCPVGAFTQTGYDVAACIRHLGADADKVAPAHSPARPPNGIVACGWPGGGVGRNRFQLNAPAGVDCRELGCRARRACPVGQAHIHEPAQATFHMAAFIKAQQKHHS